MLMNWWENLTLSALSLDGAERCHFYIPCCRGEKGGKNSSCLGSFAYKPALGG